MPAWRDIDPAAISAHLPIVWAWRYNKTEQTYFGRLAGEAITNAIGHQIRGRRLEDCFPPEAISTFRHRLDQVMTGPNLMRGFGPVYLLSGREGMGERISMPLGDDGNTSDAVFGATIYSFHGVSLDPRIRHTLAEEQIELFKLIGAS